MGVIDEKVLAVSVIGILYAVAWLLKPQTIIRVILNTILGIVMIIWVLDFFGVYSVSHFIPVNLYN